MDLRVELVPLALTLPLRQQVLHPERPPEPLPGEDGPDVAHVAALDADGRVLGTAVLLPEPFGDRADAWRLRGLAVPEELRRQGIGGRVLRYALGHVALRGGGLVWARVRVPARDFYARQGFTGDEPDDEPGPAGPYVRMWRDVRMPVD